MRLCIGHAGDVSQPSGGTNRVTAFAGGLAARGHDVTLVVPHPNEKLPARLDEVDVHPVDPPVGNAVGRTLAVAREAKRVAGPETHLQLEHSLLGGVGGLSSRSSFVLDMHDLAYARFDHVDAAYTPLARRGVALVERVGIRRADHVIAVSTYMRDILVEDWGVAPEQVTVIPNGYFSETIETFQGDNTKDGRVCFLGTLHPKVDVDALRGIAELPAVEEMVVIGDGAQRERIEQLAADHDSLRAAGRLPDAEAFELVASAAVVVNPQVESELQRSSSPVKLYYYAALGKPIVASRGPSVVSELADADAAVAPATRPAFVDAVADLLADPDRAAELGMNAAELGSTFRWTDRVDAVQQLYEEGQA